MTGEQSMRGGIYREFYLGNDEGSLSATNRLIVTVIFASVVTAVLGTESMVVQQAPDLFFVLELLFGIVFVIEYVLRLWAVGELPQFSGIKGRLHYALTPFAMLDLIVIIPLFLTWGGAEELYALRLVRVVRILALAKLGRFNDAVFRVVKALHAKQFELYASVAIAALLLLFASSLMYVIEGGSQPEAFGSIPRAMWWSIATLTTVGYGDVYPITPLGKLLAGVTAISAIGLIALPAGILASAFSDAFAKTQNDS